jgi:hypothetical protein
MGRMRQSLGRAFSRKELTINNHKRQRESAYTRDEMVARAEERLVMAFFSANHCLMRAVFRAERIVVSRLLATPSHTPKPRLTP